MMFTRIPGPAAVLGAGSRGHVHVPAPSGQHDGSLRPPREEDRIHHPH